MRLVVLAFVLLPLAGCAGDTVPEPQEPPLDVTPTTGCIRGVVVDERILPLTDVRIQVLNQDAEVLSDGEGTFTLCGLPSGTYFLVAEKQLYESVQVSAPVEAGDERPPLLRVQMRRIPGADPFLQTAQFDGFYDCAFALVFITDSCEFAVRTAHDAGVTVIPRHIQNNQNTQYLAWADTIRTVVQETWWDEDATRTFRSSLQDTPIDNLCDCSTKHMEHKGEGGYLYDRMDQGDLVAKNTGGSQSWPKMEDLEDGEVAVRGFIPFQDGPTDVDYAISLKFQIFTTFFHHFTPAEGWNLQEQDQYPVPR